MEQERARARSRKRARRAHRAVAHKDIGIGIGIDIVIAEATTSCAREGWAPISSRARELRAKATRGRAEHLGRRSGVGGQTI